MKLFKGSGVALVTPFKNNEVNYNKFEELISLHIESNTDALVILGTTGESATLSFEEKEKIIDFVIKKVGKKIPVIVGTGSNNTSEAIKLSIIAEKLGADGLLIVTPYYNKPTQRGLFEHYKLIAESVNIPIILYNVPGRTSVNLLPETVYELSKIKNIKGIKEASSDISQVAKIIDLCDKDFFVYSGNDDQIIPILSIGGVGVISVTANIIPCVIHKIVSEYLKKDKEWSISEFLQIRKLNQVMFIETNPVPVKEAMNLMGMDVGECRLPLVPLEEKNRNILKDTLEEYQLYESVK